MIPVGFIMLMVFLSLVWNSSQIMLGFSSGISFRLISLMF